jgi:hypothetical protein
MSIEEFLPQKLLSVACTIGMMLAFAHAAMAAADARLQKAYRFQEGGWTYTPTAWTCVNSLFPHQGYLPCWYLSKHTDQRTDI